MSDASDTRLQVGVSACLLGKQVRFDGGHSRSKLCLETLSVYSDFHPFCPEMAAGFGTPRPAMRLVGDPEQPTLTYSKKKDASLPVEDLTETLRAGYRDQLKTLGDLDAYILMRNSPSCGLERIKVYQKSGYPHEKKTRGLFTQDLMNTNPLLPMEEEGRLNDHALRENFILRAYTNHFFKREVLAAGTVSALIDFHSRYKLIVMAHNLEAYQELGQMVANPHEHELEELLGLYHRYLMTALAKPAKRKSHTNVLMHILGFLKKSIPGPARQSIAKTINDYRVGQLPLITPLTLLKHYIHLCGTPYIRKQRYLSPYPEDLGLRNQI